MLRGLVVVRVRDMRLGDTSDAFRICERGPLTWGEQVGLTPQAEAMKTLSRFSVTQYFAGVKVDAICATVHLRDSELNQMKSRRSHSERSVVQVLRARRTAMGLQRLWRANPDGPTG